MDTLITLTILLWFAACGISTYGAITGADMSGPLFKIFIVTVFAAIAMLTIFLVLLMNEDNKEPECRSWVEWSPRDSNWVKTEWSTCPR